MLDHDGMGVEHHHDPHAERLLTGVTAHSERIAPAYHLVPPAGIQITLIGITPLPHQPPDVGVTRRVPPCARAAGHQPGGVSRFRRTGVLK